MKIYTCFARKSDYMGNPQRGIPNVEVPNCLHV
jgi:hypothetical protein